MYGTRKTICVTFESSRILVIMSTKYKRYMFFISRTNSRFEIYRFANTNVPRPPHHPLQPNPTQNNIFFVANACAYLYALALSPQHDTMLALGIYMKGM